MKNRRVVVTGIGVIAAPGNCVNEFWRSISEGVPAIRPIQETLTPQELEMMRFKNAAEVCGFKTEDHFDEKRAALLDRFAQFALVASREAVRGARIEWTHKTRERTCITTGSCVGGQQAEEKVFKDIYGDGRTRAHPLTVPRVMANSPASQISMEFGARGPTYTIATACASSTHAIGQAFWMVRHGLADVAVTGGAEAPFCIGHLKAWEAMRVVAPDTCRPFSKNRAGMILGEGAAILVFETLEAARERGAKIYAEVVGFGMSADAQHITMPSAEGAARAITAALDDASIRPEQVRYVNAHGTGTVANDPTETQALRFVFREHTDHLAVSSTKSMHGHALGAAGAIEAVATVLALHHGVLPPTANFVEPDPECDLDVVPNEARNVEVEYAISNSFAFGGLNAVLAIKRWDG